VLPIIIGLFDQCPSQATARLQTRIWIHAIT
jgi:hypothetical protein